MKLRYQNENDFEKKEEKREAEEGKSRLRELCSKLWDATKKGAGILCFAAGTAIAVNGCGGGINQNDDAKIETVEENDGNSEEDVDALENETVDSTEEEEEITQSCPEPTTPLGGEVEPLLANSNSTPSQAFSNPDTWVTGDVELTVGAGISGNLLILGRCPNDSNGVAALGVQNGAITVEPQYRLDLKNVNAQLSPFSEAELSCDPLSSDDTPVSIYNGETKPVVKNITIFGVKPSRGIFEFADVPSAKIMVDNIESTSPIILETGGYAMKQIKSLINDSEGVISIKVTSKTGEELRNPVVRGGLNGLVSKTLRVYSLGSEDSILPTFDFSIPLDPRTNKVMACLRSCTDPTETTEKIIEIPIIITPRVVDDCGKIFDGFSIESLTLNLTFNPTRYSGSYTGEISVSQEQIDTMSDANPKILVVIRRTPPTVFPNPCPAEDVQVELNGVLVSHDKNPRTNETESLQFSTTFVLENPNMVDYMLFCRPCVSPPECQ